MIWIAAILGAIGAGWLFGHGDAAENGRWAAAAAPQLLLTALLGVTAGLYGRDRVRLRRAYASPSLAYTGKLFFFLSLSPALAWAFSPLDWAPSCLPLFAAGAAAGVGTWLSNLPPRL